MGRVSNPEPIFTRATSPASITTKRGAGDLLRGATRSLVKRWPIERCPGWLGTLHRMSVPGNVQRRALEREASGGNARVVFQLLTPALMLPGDVAACGPGHGQMLLSLGLFVRQRRPAKRVIGFESFEGPNGPIDGDGGLRRRVREYGLAATVQLATGDLPQALRRHAHRRFCFVHLERVRSASYRECLEFFAPRLTPGGVLLLDEYGDGRALGCSLAVDEFLGEARDRVERIVTGRDTVYFIRGE
jgi:hypothetical protein